jgi:hypothetical protein
MEIKPLAGIVVPEGKRNAPSEPTVEPSDTKI